jgi:histidinol-phosphate/aromatic aminotransferase/cobyric acid decarboxylase-like protein
MINKNVIHGFNLPNENLDRKYSLINQYEEAWRDWLALTKFDHAIPTNGIVESIEKICSSSDYNRFVIIENEVKFYQSILDNYNQNYIVIKPGEWDRLEANDLICLSMPFAPIASITDWYYDLCEYIQDKPIYMFIDGAYLGTINQRLYIPDNCILFAVSISKCFNASGLRAGILFCNNIPSLFKTKVHLANYNYYAMEKTIELLQTYDYYYMYDTYANIQKEICEKNNLIAADSVVLGYNETSRHCIPKLYSKS